MRKRLLVTALFVCLSLVLGYGVVYQWQNSPAACQTNSALERVEIVGNNVSVDAEVARDSADKQLGLSNRDCLTNNSAMLFVYELPNDYCFWMKDMRFPIDMIWLDDEKKIVTIKERATPQTYPESFCPTKPAQYIVEVNAGDAERLGWRIGTQLNF